MIPSSNNPEACRLKTLQLKKLSRAADGFTLLEVMVALLIVSTALPALLTLVMAQLDGAAHIREKTYAMWVAENQLTRFSLLNNKTYFPTFKLPEKDSGVTEMMGLKWQWQVETSKDEQVPILLKVDIGVGSLGLEDGSSKAPILEKADPVASLIGYMSE